MKSAVSMKTWIRLAAFVKALRAALRSPALSHDCAREIWPFAERMREIAEVPRLARCACCLARSLISATEKSSKGIGDPFSRAGWDDEQEWNDERCERNKTDWKTPRSMMREKLWGVMRAKQ